MLKTQELHRIVSPFYSCPIQILSLCLHERNQLLQQQMIPFWFQFALLRAINAVLLTPLTCAQTRGRKPRTQIKLPLVVSIRIAPWTATQAASPVLRLGVPQRPSNGVLGTPCCRMLRGTSTSRPPSLMGFPGNFRGTRAPPIVHSHLNYRPRHLVPFRQPGAFWIQPLLWQPYIFYFDPDQPYPCRHRKEPDYDSRFNLSGQGVLPVPVSELNSNVIWKQVSTSLLGLSLPFLSIRSSWWSYFLPQDLLAKVKEHEEEIAQLRRHLSDYSVKVTMHI
jgi:hypothetical protein